NLHAALNSAHESLRGSASQFRTGFEFSGVLGESCTQGWTDMHDSDALAHAWYGGADKSIRGQQEMIVLVRTARLSKIMHGSSFSEIRATPPADREGAIHIRWPCRHLLL